MAPGDSLPHPFQSGTLMPLESAPQHFCFAPLADECRSATITISDRWSSSVASVSGLTDETLAPTGKAQALLTR
jgi:hypothetical protein